MGLALVAVLLVVATAVSVARGIAFRERLPAERRAYRAWTMRSPGTYGPIHAQQSKGGDVLCATAPGGRWRQCLVLRSSRVLGGFRVPPGTSLRGLPRSGCFGALPRGAGCRG